ncbi:biotin carboxylase N-terminal domain-containing protein [Magnetospirillum sp. 15-1]|uniref:ATP-binding protein n=1 Tax=Magnetospirillum sp. 15-1 TaxID=1979370 RepID=UPI000BBC00BA|nr:biotin carboxylase N-terminal domain-containing protein [Magnetospirillum sp. 15-1]
MEPFTTILIANRGEIAARVIRTAKAQGYRTVVVYSTADAEMPYLRAADFAVHIGEAPAAQSYLDIQKLLDAAKLSGADAVHPGYGFLSESDIFADACHAADITFIGPPPEAMRAMANKAEAKRIMLQHGVPCIPGYDGEDQSDEALAREASRIGYPVMLKAVAGGGGKGMRLVEGDVHLAEGIRQARSEAIKAFGNGHLMLEKAIIAPRHIEVQIFADAHGNVVHVGDRDCSIQRRHQKIIEEAPAPGLSSELRARMGEAAVTAAKSVGYRGAGTVEFLATNAGDFYFLEMNTRLQVEHPVTEMVSGLDLVEWQIRVAAGDPLPLRQEQIAITGHSIEVRLYAEDPDTDFLPQSGRIVAWRPPVREGIRIDHGLGEGATVSTFYDPMVAKIIGYGQDRHEARRRLVRGIEDFVVGGIKTNRRFLLDCLSSSAFIFGELSTAFLDRNVFEGGARGPAPATIALGAALLYGRQAAKHSALGAWRSRPWQAESMTLEFGDTTKAVQIAAKGDQRYGVKVDEAELEVAILGGTPRLWVRIDGLEEAVDTAWDADVLHLSHRGSSFIFAIPTAEGGSSKDGGDSFACAPMPGSIAGLRVDLGAMVEKGEILLILEAMKMEHPITAPIAGKVATIHVSVGQQVGMRHVLVEIEPADSAAE